MLWKIGEEMKIVAITVFLISTLAIKGCLCERRLPICQPSYTVAYRSFEPYIIVGENNNMTGVIPVIFFDALQGCCRGDLNLNYSVQFDTQQDVVEVISNYTVDFVMPVQTDLRSERYLSYPYVPIIESPGVAFYVVPGPSAGEAIIEAVSSTWPLIMIMFVLVAVSGACFWILEMICTRESRRSLCSGIIEGMWWAFVSMTTVGYGDICPQTKPGKIFSICWVMTGVACCALFTAYVTTILTSACLAEDTTIYGSKVGVLKGGEIHQMAIKKNAFPFGFDSVDDILTALHEESIQATLIDSYVAAEHQKKLNVFRLQDIIELVTSNGVVFQNNGIKHEECIKEYLLSRQDLIFKQISSIVRPLRTSESQSRAEEKSKNLLDPYSPSFFIPVSVTCFGLILLVALGSLWDWIKRVRLEKELERREIGKEMTLTSWRRCYLQDLQDVVRAIHNDANNLKNKCQVICERLDKTSYGLVTKRTDI